MYNRWFDTHANQQMGDPHGNPACGWPRMDPRTRVVRGRVLAVRSVRRQFGVVAGAWAHSPCRVSGLIGLATS